MVKYRLCVILLDIYLQDGWTAIYNAALAGYADIVKILIDHGAKVDLRDTVCIDIKLD